MCDTHFRDKLDVQYIAKAIKLFVYLYTENSVEILFLQFLFLSFKVREINY